MKRLGFIIGAVLGAAGITATAVYFATKDDGNDSGNDSNKNERQEQGEEEGEWCTTGMDVVAVDYYNVEHWDVPNRDPPMLDEWEFNSDDNEECRQKIKKSSYFGRFKKITA